jgi:hypothetical protein
VQTATTAKTHCPYYDRLRDPNPTKIRALILFGPEAEATTKCSSPDKADAVARHLIEHDMYPEMPQSDRRLYIRENLNIFLISIAGAETPMIGEAPTKLNRLNPP